MSLSSYPIARSQGMDMIAIPAFPGRRFMHTEWSYHSAAGISGPRDLDHKRVGIGESQQTSSLWTRGIFEHDFGVSQYQVDCYILSSSSRGQEPSLDASQPTRSTAAPVHLCRNGAADAAEVGSRLSFQAVFSVRLQLTSPPSRTSVWPVMKSLSAEARKGPFRVGPRAPDFAASRAAR
jgi:hypothetical protein